jgi:hypothetical protein
LCLLWITIGIKFNQFDLLTVDAASSVYLGNCNVDCGLCGARASGVSACFASVAPMTISSAACTVPAVKTAAIASVERDNIFFINFSSSLVVLLTTHLL